MSSLRQKALFLQSKHGSLVVAERSVPKPARGQLLVKVHTAALNPVDFKIQQSGIFIETYPAILGVDMAGVVEEVGDGVEKFARGDKIFAHGSFSNDEAAFQQYALASADYAAKIPHNLDFDRAATVPLGFDTASVGLYSEQLGAGLAPPWLQDGLGIYAGKPILIMGGSASVGMYAIQLARLSGFSPIIATASSAHEKELKALGATNVIDRRLGGDEFTAALERITQHPIQIVYDAIASPETQKQAWSFLARNGTLVLTLSPVVTEEEGRGRSVIATYGSPHSQPNQSLCRESWSVLEKWLRDGVIKPNKFEVLPNGLGGISAGLEQMQAGKVSGKKLVAHPQETA